jgi:hypothetical protein
MEYALFWRQSPVVLFPLKGKEKKKIKKTPKPLLTGIYSPLFPLPYNPAVPQLRCHSRHAATPGFHLSISPFPPYPNPLPTMTAKVVRTMS